MFNSDYLYTLIHNNYDSFIPEKNSSYLYGYSPENRSYCADIFKKIHKDSVDFVEIVLEEDDIIKDTSSNLTYNLRSSKNIADFFQAHEAETIYIDVTGLDFRICASLINNAIKAITKTKITNIKIIYAEPESYKIKQFRSEGVFHDLSEKINGIKPLPGFASIIPDDLDNVLFVVLLGFEGGRFTHLLENIQLPYENIFPIIGVPGYRAEYPFIAYWGNRKPLEETDTWRKIKYAAANSLVETFDVLTKILRQNSTFKIKVAPIGSKPHAIGAMLFAIKHAPNVELVYDNPIRTRQRTEGIGKLIECSVSQFLAER
jgi:hypothetical protein